MGSKLYAIGMYCPFQRNFKSVSILLLCSLPDILPTSVYLPVDQNPHYTIEARAYRPAGGGERACNSHRACTEGEMLAVTKNRTLPFSKACPNPLKNGPKSLAKLYNKELESSYSMKVNADCTAAFATRSRIWFYF